MNKKDLIRRVSHVRGCTIQTSTAYVDIIFQIITQALKDRNEVRIAGFGTFKSVDRSPRTGVNPKTGEPISIQAKSVVKFKAAKGL